MSQAACPCARRAKKKRAARRPAFFRASRDYFDVPVEPPVVPPLVPEPLLPAPLGEVVLLPLPLLGEVVLLPDVPPALELPLAPLLLPVAPLLLPEPLVMPSSFRHFSRSAPTMPRHLLLVPPAALPVLLLPDAPDDEAPPEALGVELLLLPDALGVEGVPLLCAN